MRFVKMHGIGNDYVYLDAVGAPALEARFEGAAGADLVRRMSDRHRGIGSDGVILVCRARAGADVRMRMLNADGSESEMCGNGIRCVAKLAYDRLGIHANPMRVETGHGVLSIAYETAGGRLATATVDMGEPILEPSRVPVDASRLRPHAGAHRWTVDAAGEPWVASFVSMGNPHAVFFHADNPGLAGAPLDRFDLRRLGPMIETHPAFPNRINAHIVAVGSAHEATMRTWERGAGLTQACGTGACAVCVAGVRTGRLARDVLLHLPGGDLRIHWSEADGHVRMTGPATEVFEGEWPE